MRGEPDFEVFDPVLVDANEVHELPAYGEPPGLLVLAPVRLGPHPVVGGAGATLAIGVGEVPSAQLDHGLLDGLLEARVRDAVGDIGRRSNDYPPVALLTYGVCQGGHCRSSGNSAWKRSDAFGWPATSPPARPTVPRKLRRRFSVASSIRSPISVG